MKKESSQNQPIDSHEKTTATGSPLSIAKRAEALNLKTKKVAEPVASKKPLLTQILSRFKLPSRGGFQSRTIDERTLSQKLFQWGMYCFYALCILGSIVLGWVIYLVWDLPSAEEVALFSVKESTKILDTNGELLYEIHGSERREYVKLGSISPYMKSAILAVEDDTFYTHHGFSIRGISRALYNSLLQRGGLQGGSTITQQFVKNAYLSPERKIARKIKEFAIALKVESAFTKDQILEMYLNKISFGSNIYGIQAASEAFFHKNAKELTLAEAAALASLPKAPSFLSPYGANKDRLLARKDYALSRMYDTGRISQTQLASALEQELIFHPISQEIKAPHFVFHVRELLEKKYGKELVEQGGLTVYTTLNLQHQEWAEEAVAFRRDHNLENWDANNAALVAIDPRNGHITAMLGSADFFGDETRGQFNAALSERQPGSTFKPFAYAAAFLAGHSPATVVYDVLTDFAEEEDEEYIPENHDGEVSGPVSFRYALAQSLNIPAVKALHLGGVQKTMDLVKEMGIRTLKHDADHYGLSLVLGGGGVRLTEITEAYSVFANGGVHHPVTPIIKVVDRHGTVLEENTLGTGDLVLHPGVSYQVSEILSDNDARAAVFGQNSWLKLKNAHRAAAKTGTSQDFRDGWTIGYTPFLATGVWVGNNDNAPMKEGAYGTVVAGPIWNRFMTLATENEVPREFYRPDSVVARKVSLLDGRLANEQTHPEYTRFENFVLDLNLPRQSTDPIRGAVVCRATGNIANEHCPSGMKELWIFEEHTSVISKENWQEGVDAWALENTFLTPEDFLGLGLSQQELATTPIRFKTSSDRLPTTVDSGIIDSRLIARMPKVSFPELKAENILQEGLNKVAVTVKAPQGFKQLVLSIDDTILGTYTRQEALYDLYIPEGFLASAHSGQLAALSGSLTDDGIIVVDTVSGEMKIAPELSHTFPLTATLYDVKNLSQIATTTVYIRPETQAPSVVIRQPLPSTPYTAFDTGVYIRADIEDQSDIESVTILFDGDIISTLSSAPWEISHDFGRPIGSGAHTITVVARDIHGNEQIARMDIVAR